MSIIDKLKTKLMPKKEEKENKVAMVECPVCGGSGKRHYSDEDFPCPNCEGKGKVRKEKE